MTSKYYTKGRDKEKIKPTLYFSKGTLEKIQKLREGIYYKNSMAEFVEQSVRIRLEYDRIIKAIRECGREEVVMFNKANGEVVNLGRLDQGQLLKLFPKIRKIEPGEKR